VQLVLDHWSLTDENTPLAASFTGHYNGDGIALSVDGVHWVKVTDLTGSFTGQSFALDSVLQQAQVAAGSTDLSNVRIKFQQFDDYPSPDDGREFDNIWVRIILAEKPWRGGDHPQMRGNGGSGPDEGYKIGETEDHVFVPSRHG
jgi:hypothetical protein